MEIEDKMDLYYIHIIWSCMFSVRLSSFRYNNTAIVELYANNKEV